MTSKAQDQSTSANAGKTVRQIPSQIFFGLIVLVFPGTIVAQVSTGEKAEATSLPDTGQTVRFTQTFGEDADYAGSQPNFIDNKDGTVTDQTTGLMWQKSDGGEMTWERAKQYAQDSRLGGHSDWRLPTSIELFAIMNHGKHGPAMDTQVFPKSEARYWWTDANRVDDKSKVWTVNTGGGIGAHAKSETTSAGGDRPIHVRCVRGKANFGTGPRLKDNGDGTVTDQRTGLVWQKIQSDKAMTWEEALKHCDELEIEGNKDWRLPNIKELRSLSDDSKIRPSLDKTFFPGAKAAFYWSSTSQANRPERAWYVDFTTGLVTYSDKTEKLYLLAVRDESSKPGSREKPTPNTNSTQRPDQKSDPRRPGNGKAGGKPSSGKGKGKDGR